MSIEYIVQEKTVWEVLEIRDDDCEKCYIMADFESERDANAYKEECEAAED